MWRAFTVHNRAAQMLEGLASIQSAQVVSHLPMLTFPDLFKVVKTSGNQVFNLSRPVSLR
jgi:hypothetical protein